MSLETSTAPVDYKYLDVAVVNTAVNNIPFASLQEFAYSATGAAAINPTPLTYQVEGESRKVVFSGGQFAAPAVSVFTKDGKTVLVTSSGFSDAEVQAFVNGMAPRKDVDALQTQWLTPPGGKNFGVGG